MRRICVTVAIGAALAAPPAALAATTGNLTVRPLPEPAAGAFGNYDFNGRTAAANNVDWPVTFVFRGPTASVSSVRSLLSAAGYAFTGSTQYGYVSQGTSGTWQWVSDGGRKRSFQRLSVSLPRAPRVGAFSFVHIRLYAPSGGYFAGLGTTRYVVATTHVDLNELWSPVYGWSESAAQQLARYDLAPLVGQGRIRTIAPDSLDLGNPEGDASAATTPDQIVPVADVLQANHRWQNDGRATVVTLP